MKHKYILQKDEKDCAATCLYNIIRYYNGYIDIDKLYKMLNTDKTGTSIYDIVQVANKLGLDSNAYRCELNDLCNVTFPVIAHIKVDSKFDHFVILDKIEYDEIYIHDPIRGYMKYDICSFLQEWSSIIVAFDKTENLIHDKKNSNFYIKDYLSSNKKTIISTLVLSFFSSFLALFHSVYLSYLYNNVYTPMKSLIIFFFILIISMIINYIRNELIINYSMQFDKKMTNNIYNKILSLPLQYHHDRPVGDIVARINDLSYIKELINTISFSFIIDLMYILTICIVVFIKNKTLFLILLIMICIYFIIYIILRNKIINYSMSNKLNNSDTSSYLIESLLGIDTIKNLNIESNFMRVFKNKYNKFQNLNVKYHRLLLNLDLIENFISSFACILLISIGMILQKKNVVTFSFILSLNSIIVYLFISLKNIISLDQTIIESKNSYKRLKSFFYESVIKQNSDKLSFSNNIEFNNLNFSYNDSNVILNNINFNINKGEFVFINGKSGKGKSTIFKLLTKQLECEENMIKIDNTDINKISRENIIDNICMMSQNEYIFTDSILNNIRLFKRANKKEIDKVIRITNVNKILEDKKINLDFLLEENGHNISGGERQKILLARALLRNKKILILDETTSEIDIDSEREILKKIKTEYKNLTLILISHRLNNSDLFNKVIKI